MNLNASPTATSVARRFWFLLALVLVMALVSSALAVRFVTQPFFRDYQQNAISAQAEDSATHLNAILQHNEALLAMIAQDPTIIDIAIGHSQNATYLNNVLADLQLPQEFAWISFYDAFHAEITRFDIREGERRRFNDADIEDMLSELERPSADARLRVLLQTRGEVSLIVMATPIFHQGFVEGFLVSGHHINRTKIFPPNNVVKATSLVLPINSLLNKGPEVIRPLPDIALSVALTPDEAAVISAGKAVLSNSMTAIAVVLIGAFGIFALAGKAVIVAPHRALELKQAELSELAAIAERAHDAILITDLSGKLVWANPAFERLTGHAIEDVRGMSPASFLQGPDTDPDTRARVRDALAAREAIQVELLNYRYDGTPYWISLSISPLKTDRGKHYGYMAISNDITEARTQREAIVAAKQEIENQALHDPLTGLPNRRALDQALKLRRLNPDLHSTIVRIDLDHFKYVNDTMGHEAGDFLLCEVAKILQEETKTSDLAARVGGDEFVLLLDPKSTPDEGMLLAERMLDRIRAPKVFENRTLRTGASFGVAGTLDGILTLDELIIGADAALYQAKEAGRNRARRYTADLHQSVLCRRTLARELRRAVARQEFEPYFQPQFNAITHEVVGVETLARWHSPELGIQMPGDFLPVAEQLSLVEEIDSQIFSKAFDQIKSLRSHGIIIPRVSVNVTVERIQNDDVYNRIRSFGRDGPVIVFEVLESVLVEEQSDLFRFGLDRLREAGVEIEVDDFGSGHASIVGLMHLRPDAMKIDQRLIRPITDDPLAHGLLKHIVGMAELMDLKIIAEGVETMEHARILRDIGCDTLQGYAFCKPLPLHELQRFMLEHEARLSLRRMGA